MNYPVEEKELLEYYITQGIGKWPSAGADKILEEWYDKKQFLYKLLGDNLIIEKEIAIEKDKNILCEDFSHRYDTDTNMRVFIKEYYDWISMWIRDTEYKNALYNLISEITLVDNRWTEDTLVFSISDCEIRLQKGAKVSKVLGKIAKHFDLKGYEDFRIAHSQILNEKTLHGTLCLSIHPMDFLTMSDNDCSWSSCLDFNDGEYRGGTVEMMNSPIVVEAYLKSAVDMNIGHNYSWNSKRWRELFIVDPDTSITAIKGYPYWNRELEEIVLDWLIELADKNCGLKYLPYELINTDKLGEEGQPYFYYYSGEAMYNDIRYTHYRSLKEGLEPLIYHISYGGKRTCLDCGDIEPYFDNENDLMCSDCDPKLYCCGCGERVYDYYHEVNDEIYCDWCYGENIIECDCCGDKMHYSDTVNIYLKTGRRIGTRAFTICNWCLNHNEATDYFDKSAIHKLPDRFEYARTYYIDIKDLEEEGLAYYNAADRDKILLLSETWITLDEDEA